MKTTLETFVGYLSGRGGTSAVPFARSLDDPNSDPSRWLAEVRDRTRTMFDAGPSARLAFPDDDASPFAARPSGRSSSSSPAAARLAMAACAVAAVLLVAFAASWWGQAARLRRLESELALRDGQWQARVDRLETAIRDRPAPSKAPAPAATASLRAVAGAPTAAPKPSRDGAPELLLARLEAGLSRLDRRLSETEAPMPAPTPTPTEPEETPSDQYRRDLEGMRRDVEARDKELRQGLLEMRTALQGVVQYLQQSAAVQQGMMQGGLSIPYQFPSAVFPGGVGLGNPAIQGGASPHPGQHGMPAHPGAGGHPAANPGHSK